MDERERDTRTESQEAEPLRKKKKKKADFLTSATALMKTGTARLKLLFSRSLIVNNECFFGWGGEWVGGWGGCRLQAVLVCL